MAIQLNKGRTQGLLDMTPMIDMVFNLLIFFMVVTRFAEEERDMKVLLPSGTEAMPLTARPHEIFVNIDSQGGYYFRGRQLTHQELGQVLRDAAVNNPANQSVVIRADKRVPWDFVATAMRLCNEAGIRDYSASLTEE